MDAPKSLVSQGAVSWKDDRFCQRSFAHPTRWLSGFVFQSICMLDYLYQFMYVEWPSASLGWSQVNCDEYSFESVLAFVQYFISQ